MTIKTFNKLFTWRNSIISICLIRLVGPAVGMPTITWPEVAFGVCIYIVERKLKPKSIQGSKDGVKIVLQES